jgi:hypothetical protein
MSKLLTVEWFKNPKHLSEIYQQTGMIFAFVTSPKLGTKVCHEWVKCRDFLHDAVRSQVTGKSCGIYGFSFDPAQNPNLDMKKMRMLVSKHDLADKTIEDFKNKMKAALVLINHYEKQAKISLSKMQEVNPSGSNKKVIYLFTGSGIWMTSPFLVSMYTFLIRLGDKELKFTTSSELLKEFSDLQEKAKTGKISDNDANYLCASGNKMHFIIKNRNILFPKKDGLHDIFFAGYDINSFHNGCGIRSLSLSQTPDKSLNTRIKEYTEKELAQNDKGK